MKSATYLISVAIQFVSILGISNPLQAGGLSTQLGEVVIENLQVGKSYNLKELANLSLIVTNTSEFTVNLKIEALQSGDSELKQGSAPIPDISWVKLSESTFTLAPSYKAISDIILSIPDEDQYLGKKYQVMIWSHTLGGSEGGMFLAYGLKSRIIFTTENERPSDSNSVATSGASADFVLTPHEIFLNTVVLGRVCDVQEETGSVLTITNLGNKERVFRLRSQTISESSASLTEGYEDAPDRSYLSFSKSEFLVPAHGTKSVRMLVKFPQKPEYSGKQFMFIIHALSGNESVTTGTYSRLYVSTLE